MLAAGSAATAMSFANATAAEFVPSARFPDPAIKVLDRSFLRYRLPLVSVERLTTGMAFGEGPVWFGDGRYLLWSDIPNNRIMRWEEETGAVSVFRKPSNQANGNTRDRQGRLVSCEHRGRRVTRTEYDGEITVLADRFDGKRLNSPDDVVVKSDDSIWFTDPPYGIRSNYNGSIEEQELPINVYRLDKTGRLTVVADDINMPDGLAFSPDEKTLYIIEDGSTPPVIRAYDVVADGNRIAICRSTAPMCALAAIARAACSWRRAGLFMPFGSARRERLGAEARAKFMNEAVWRVFCFARRNKATHVRSSRNCLMPIAAAI
jgi:gluconolactonase